jgi:hypothetical protein
VVRLTPGRHDRMSQTPVLLVAVLSSDAGRVKFFLGEIGSLERKEAKQRNGASPNLEIEMSSDTASLTTFPPRRQSDVRTGAPARPGNLPAMRPQFCRCLASSLGSKIAPRSYGDISPECRNLPTFAPDTSRNTMSGHSHWLGLRERTLAITR